MKGSVVATKGFSFFWLLQNTLLQTGLVMAVFQVACLVWLFFGYQLEFEGKPVFLEVWEPFDL